MARFGIACNICGRIIDPINPYYSPPFCKECAKRMRAILYPKEPSEYEYALQIIAEMFDPPCSYSNKDHDCAELLMEHAEGFCEECNNHTTYADCWRKYFEVRRRMEATE